MKIFAVFTLLLLVSSSQGSGGFFASLGNFFETLGQHAADLLATTAANILKNATATATNLLAETTQLAMFEVGNTLGGSGKRDLGAFLHLFEGELSSTLGKTVHDVETFIQTAKALMDGLLHGHFQPLLVLQAIPELKTAINDIKTELNSGFFTKVVGLLDPHRSRRQLNFLAHVGTQLQGLLEPLTHLVENELGNVVHVLESTAQGLLGTQDPTQLVSGLLSVFHL